MLSTVKRCDADDPFARARIAAVQSRVALVVSGPRAPPPHSSLFALGAASARAEDSHASRASCGTPRTSTLAPPLMSPLTPCSWQVSPSPARVVGFGARVRGYNRYGQATQARPPAVSDVITGPWGASAGAADDAVTVGPGKLTTLDLLVGLLLCHCHLTSPRGSLVHDRRALRSVGRAWLVAATSSHSWKRSFWLRCGRLSSKSAARCGRNVEELLRRAEERLVLSRRPVNGKQRDGLDDPSSRAQGHHPACLLHALL